MCLESILTGRAKGRFNVYIDLPFGRLPLYLGPRIPRRLYYTRPTRPMMARFSGSRLLLGLTSLLAVVLPQVGAVDVTVGLNYSTYIGTAQSGTGVTQWLGIRYAAPPLGSLRFARPQDPPVVRTPQPAHAVGSCSRPPRGKRSED